MDSCRSVDVLDVALVCFALHGGNLGALVWIGFGTDNSPFVGGQDSCFPGHGDEGSGMAVWAVVGYEVPWGLLANTERRAIPEEQAVGCIRRLAGLEDTLAYKC